MSVSFPGSVRFQDDSHRGGVRPEERNRREAQAGGRVVRLLPRLFGDLPRYRTQPLHFPPRAWPSPPPPGLGPLRHFEEGLGNPLPLVAGLARPCSHQLANHVLARDVGKEEAVGLVCASVLCKQKTVLTHPGPINGELNIGSRKVVSVCLYQLNKELGFQVVVSLYLNIRHPCRIT